MAKSDLTILTTSESYAEFARLTQAALRTAKVWRHVEKQVAEPSPADSNKVTADETREIRIWNENEEAALGIILERLDAANTRLVTKMNAKQAWDKLASTHVLQTGNRQYQLYQNLAATSQEPNEPLPSFFQRLELAGDQFSASLKSGATADDVINLLITFLALNNMEPTEDNGSFETTLSIAGTLSRDTVKSSFMNEQTRREVASKAKESGLAAKIGRQQRKAPKPGSPTCIHCGKTHKSEDCYSKYPDKKPQWMKDREVEQQRKRREQQQQANKPTTAAHAAKAEDSSDDEEPEAAMATGRFETAQAASPPVSTSPDSFADQNWIADSGATSSMTPHRHWIRNMVPCRVAVTVASGETVYAAGRGEVWFEPIINGAKAQLVSFSRVLYVPELSNSLFAVIPTVRKRDVTASFSKDKVLFESAKGNPVMTASYKGKAAYLDGKTIPAELNEAAFTTSSSPTVTLSLLHRRMAHIGADRLKKLVKLEMAKGVTPKDASKLEDDLPKICEPCLAGKQHREPFPHSTSSTLSPLELIVADLHGPLPPTDEGYRYWLLFLDVHTRFTWGFKLKRKKEAFECFKALKVLIEKQTGLQIKRLRDDKGGEFIGKKWDAFLTENGIIHERTTTNTPQQNGIVERKNRVLEEAITSMLAQAKLPRAVWGQALQLAIRITNASPSSALKDKTPYEALYGEKPDLSMLRVFGCRAYVHVQKEKGKDAKWHTQRCIYLGFEDGYKGFKCYNPETNQFVISRDVVFDEDEFPGIPWIDGDKEFVPISGGYYPVPSTPAPAPGAPAALPGLPPLPPAPGPAPPSPTSSNSSASSSLSPPPAPGIPLQPQTPPNLAAEHDDDEYAPPRTPTNPPSDDEPLKGFRLESEEQRSPAQTRNKHRGVGYKNKGKDKEVKEEPISPPASSVPPAPVPFRYNETPKKSKKGKARKREAEALKQYSWSVEPEEVGRHSRRTNRKRQQSEEPEDEPIVPGAFGPGEPPRQGLRRRQPPEEWWKAQPHQRKRLKPSFDVPSDEEMEDMEPSGSGQQHQANVDEDDFYDDECPTPSGGAQNANSEAEVEMEVTPEPPAPSDEDVFQALEFVYPNEEHITWEQAVERAFKVAADNTEPRSFREAMLRPDKEKWFEAALTEIQAHVDNRTWDIVQLPADRKAIGSRWVFKVKRDAEGKIERYKGRLVAQGFSQRPGIDFHEVFAPTMRWGALRTILALAAIEDMEVESIDISNAYLNGVLPEEEVVYMHQPEGFYQKDDSWVCRLRKGLYGLKQSGRLWYQRLGEELEKLGFKRLVSDPSIYAWGKDGIKVIVPVFVDDLTLVSKSKDKIQEVKDALSKVFKLRDLGPTTFLLGVQISRDRSSRTLHLSQRQYVVDLLERFGMADCAPVQTPMEPGLKLTKDMSPATPEEIGEMKDIPYLNAVGALNYLAIATRPDISYAVGKLARFNSNPGMQHWKAVKHLFRYLQGTKDMRLTYAPDPNVVSIFNTYTDADFAGDKENGKSTNGYIVKIGTGAVSWASKLQGVIAKSSTESEFYGASFAGTEIKWLRNLLQELGYSFPSPSPLFIDNQSSIQVLKDAVHHSRMKHIPVAEFWIRDEVSKVGSISVHYCPTEDMPADLLTKALPRQTVIHLRERMGLHL